MPVRSLRDGTIDLADSGGTGGANVITVDLEDGGLSWTEETPHNFILDRGVLHHVRLADQVPISGTLSLKYQTHLDPNSANITPYEAVTQSGGAAAWVSDASNGGDGYAFITELTITDPNGGTSEVITLAEVYAEQIQFAEGEPFNTLSFAFRANIAAATYA